MGNNQPRLSEVYQKDSYAKIHTPVRRRLSEYVIQKQNSYAQIHRPERQKQKSTPDILQLLKKYQKCHTIQSNQQLSREGSAQFMKKHKTVHNYDASPIKVSQEAMPLKNILINKKRSNTGDREQAVQKLQALKRKITEKVPNPLEMLQPEVDQLSNKITFQASLRTEDSKIASQNIETPGTAQFMQSNREDYLLDSKFDLKYSKDSRLYVESKILKCQKQSNQQPSILEKRKPSCGEEAFKPVQKTVSLHKPYFESNRQEDNSLHFTNRLECRKIMIILDQDKEKILEQISLNPVEIHSSPTSSLWDKAMKIDRLNESMKQAEESIIKQQVSRQKKDSVKNENVAYWKLRELEIKKKR